MRRPLHLEGTRPDPTPAGPSIFFIVLALVGALAGASTARAAEDYDPESNDWNGLRILVDTAAEAHVALEVLDDLDWSHVDPDDVLVFVYPHHRVDPDELRAFVADGGRAVVFDDFGRSADALAAFGMTRTAPPSRMAHAIDGNPALPVWEPRAQHFLFFSIAGKRRIVANHPAALKVASPAEPILTWPGGKAALVAEARDDRHDGAVLAVADASILINQMMLEHGNKQFAANCLRYYCRREPCHATLVLPWATLHGHYLSHHTSLLDRASLQRLAGKLNAALAAPPHAVDPLASTLLAAFVAAVAFAASFAAWGRPAQPPWPRAPAGANERTARARQPLPSVAFLVDAASGLLDVDPGDADSLSRWKPPADDPAARQAALRLHAFLLTVQRSGARARPWNPPSSERAARAADDFRQLAAARGYVRTDDWALLAVRARSQRRRRAQRAARGGSPGLGR